MVEDTLSPGGLHAEITVRRSDRFQLDLALAISPGSTVALLGPNGAGKSTAVGAIAGLVPIDTGRVVLNGSVLDDPTAGVFVPAEDRNVGVMFQDNLLFPRQTVLDNVAFGLRSRGVPREKARSRARRWLDRLGLQGIEGRRPGDISGGQAQRVALARALVTDPDLLLLDEPLSALDVTTRTELRRILAEHLDAFAGPRLLITHDPTEAFLLADEVHIIEAGTVTQQGSPDEIRLRPRTSYAADLAGSNLIAGTARAGVVDTGEQQVHIAESDIEGQVLLIIQPSAISVYPGHPEGSPRNSWPTVVDRVERLGARVRIRTGSPLPLTIELTELSRAEMGIDPGTQVWVAIKATEVVVESDDRARY